MMRLDCIRALRAIPVERAYIISTQEPIIDPETEAAWRQVLTQGHPGRWSFLPSDTASTTAALVFYTPGLVGYSAVRIAVPCFYAMRNSRAMHQAHVTVEKVAGSHRLASTQEHFAIDVLGFQERRRRAQDLVREIELAD